MSYRTEWTGDAGANERHVLYGPAGGIPSRVGWVSKQASGEWHFCAFRQFIWTAADVRGERGTMHDACMAIVGLVKHAQSELKQPNSGKAAEE